MPPERLPEAQHIARGVDARLTVIGRVVEASVIAARTTEGDYRPLRQIEHDSFGDGLRGTGYFTSLGAPQLCFGDELPAAMSQHLSALTLFD